MKGEDNPARITIPLTHAHNTENVFVNEGMILTAMQYKKYLGVGIPPVPTPAVEYLIISLAELKHFIDWIFDPLNTTVLKQRGHDGERGCTHQLKDYAARTWTPYKESAKQADVSGISQNNYNMMLKLPIFKRVKSEECACNQCVVKGWEGILKLGIKLLREVDGLPVWFVDAKGVRAKPSSPQGIVIHACVRVYFTCYTHTLGHNHSATQSITHYGIRAHRRRPDEAVDKMLGLFEDTSWFAHQEGIECGDALSIMAVVQSE
jgi:hypothetical protein